MCKKRNRTALCCDVQTAYAIYYTYGYREKMSIQYIVSYKFQFHFRSSMTRWLEPLLGVRRKKNRLVSDTCAEGYVCSSCTIRLLRAHWAMQPRRRKPFPNSIPLAFHTSVRNIEILIKMEWTVCSVFSIIFGVYVGSFFRDLLMWSQIPAGPQV